ncbi:MAG: hypothetical protein K2P81_10100 [Bacteriovoracaceae bacterium]|nr:hypothetical protein [Bacteriovoracaceae bacterium]
MMTSGFRFGIEAEFLLARKSDSRPLWYKDVSFKQLDQIFSQISLEGLPSLEGLSAEPPHEKLMPFIVEGYGIVDENFKVIDAYPKGAEIRTPVCYSIDEVMKVYEECYRRFKTALSQHDMVPVAMSHHPIETKFSGPQNKRRHDFWQWAMEVMTTYGPDINVSFPEPITKKLFSDLEDLNAKVNYYAPALAAISLASPFYKGQLWENKSQLGLSYRTFKRSIIAPAIELHADENFRIEFKVFEMSSHSIDFKNYILLVLALFLDETLKGRSSAPERIYDLGLVSRLGIKAPEMRERFMEIFSNAPAVLKKHGFNPDSLNELTDRIENGHCPSREMQTLFKAEGLNAVIKKYSVLHTLSGEEI